MASVVMFRIVNCLYVIFVLHYDLLVVHFRKSSVVLTRAIPKMVTLAGLPMNILGLCDTHTQKKIETIFHVFIQLMDS